MEAPLTSDLRRSLPSVEQVLKRPEVRALEERYGRETLLRHVRDLLDDARQRAARGEGASLEALLEAFPEELSQRLERASSPSLAPLINATGVVIHTNLGRAPLSEEAARRVAAIASSYSNLEYDLERGERGDREVHTENRLKGLLGVEGVTVVNNNAAAVLLAVNTFAEGREVLVSRGELVEIGGSFRIPDVLRKGGARLKEVGTTNRTRLTDYRAAIGRDTGMILKVHPSNYRIVGFTEAPTLRELAGLARETGLPLIEDLGSGLLVSFEGAPPEEPTVAESLAQGADLITFSGDKLLGGPQAGIVVGQASASEAMRRNPLYRALRVDKMTMAALDAVLSHYESGRANADVPVLRMLSQSAEAIRVRAEALAKTLRAARPAGDVAVTSGTSVVGGGAAPTVGVPTSLLTIGHPSPQNVAAALRRGRPPVVARVAEGRLVVDLRTVFPEEEATLREALLRVLSET